MRPVAEAPSLKMWPVFWAMIATAHERVLPAFIASGTIEDGVAPRSTAFRPLQAR